MIEVLEEIIEDENTNPTARCTAIRTLREIQAQQPHEDGRFAELDAFAATRRPSARRSKKTSANRSEIAGDLLTRC